MREMKKPKRKKLSNKEKKKKSCGGERKMILRVCFFLFIHATIILKTTRR